MLDTEVISGIEMNRFPYPQESTVKCMRQIINMLTNNFVLKIPTAFSVWDEGNNECPMISGITQRTR